MRAGSHGTFEFARRNANKAEEQRRRVHMRMDSDSEMSEQQRLRISVSSSDVVGFADMGFGDLREEDAGDDSDISDTLSSEFTETIDSNPIRANFLQGARGRLLQLPGSPALAMLHELPPARPISMVQPVSLLTQLLNKDPEDVRPLDQYNIHEGSGELRSIALKIFFPHRKNPLTPVELQVRREDRQPDGNVKETTVVNAIGFCLYMYNEEKMEPPLEKEQMNVNKWTMRMVDDGEADMDFPRKFLDSLFSFLILTYPQPLIEQSHFTHSFSRTDVEFNVAPRNSPSALLHQSNLKKTSVSHP